MFLRDCFFPLLCDKLHTKRSLIVLLPRPLGLNDAWYYYTNNKMGVAMDTIVSAEKTDVLRIRINPIIRKELEAVYAKNGLTLTDAINVFFQQSLNAGGFPFQVTENNAELVKAKAMTRLMKELKKGDDCTEVYSDEETIHILGVDE